MLRDKLQQGVLLFLLLASLSVISGQIKHINMGPYSIHSWRQSFGLSFAQNYLIENRPFLEPAVHWTDLNGERSSLSEFPLFYYCIAKVWSITGKKHWIYRGITLSLVYAGVFSLFYFTYALTSSLFCSYLSALLFFCTPVLIFYGFNFVIDAPVLGISFVGFYALFLHYHKQKKLYLFVAGFLLIITSLSKPTLLIPLVAMIVTGFIYLKRSQLKVYIPWIILLIILNTAWILYVEKYNALHNHSLFLRSWLPIWDLKTEQILPVFNNFRQNVLPLLFPVGSFILLTLIYLISLFFPIRAEKAWFKTFSLWGWFGAIAYFLFFYQVMDIHDYYMLEVIFLIPLMFIHIYLVQENIIYRRSIFKKLYKGAAYVLLMTLVLRSSALNRLRFNVEDPFLTYVEDWYYEDEKAFFSWVRYDYMDRYYPLEQLALKLDSIGINRNDIVVITPDNTPCIGLYLLDRPGYSLYSYSEIAEESIPYYFSGKGAQYWILHDRSWFEKDFVKLMQASQIYADEMSKVYRLNN